MPPTIDDALKKVLQQARFHVPDLVFYEEQPYTIMRRFYRRSTNTILYDIRHFNTGKVLAEIPQAELRTEREAFSGWKPRNGR